MTKGRFEAVNVDNYLKWCTSADILQKTNVFASDGSSLFILDREDMVVERVSVNELFNNISPDCVVNYQGHTVGHEFAYLLGESKVQVGCCKFSRLIGINSLFSIHRKDFSLVADNTYDVYMGGKKVIHCGMRVLTAIYLYCFRLGNMVVARWALSGIGLCFMPVNQIFDIRSGNLLGIISEADEVKVLPKFRNGGLESKFLLSTEGLGY